MFVFWVTGCFENSWLDNAWDCVGSVTDSYYEFSNSSHAALDIRNGFSYVTVLLPFIRHLEGKRAEGILHSSAMGTGLTLCLPHTTRQFTESREKLQSFCNVNSAVDRFSVAYSTGVGWVLYAFATTKSPSLLYFPWKIQSSPAPSQIPLRLAYLSFTCRKQDTETNSTTITLLESIKISSNRKQKTLFRSWK